MKSIKRRTVFFLFGLLGLLLSASPCLAETARDITAEAKITASTHLPSSVRVSDRDFSALEQGRQIIRSYDFEKLLALMNRKKQPARENK